jgi:branched-chain amino acid transport system ATP-binding protein
MLEVKELSVYYGPIRAVNGITIRVDRGEVVALLGPNGAGKTSTLRAVLGLGTFAGEVRFQGELISGLAPSHIVRKGLALVPEGRRVFPRLSVLDNLLLGAYARRDRAQVSRDLEAVFGLFPRLAERRRQNAGTLSGGEQQMLAIGRALMSRPTLLLMDEPSMGLAPVLVQQIFESIREINRAGVTMLVVEQNARMALGIAHRAYVMEGGVIAMSGTAEELRRDPRVVGSYLGG